MFLFLVQALAGVYSREINDSWWGRGRGASELPPVFLLNDANRLYARVTG
jgi:hypothetical protein